MTLNNLAASDDDFGSATAGVRVLTNGDVEEGAGGSWTAQNSGVEWIDDGGATSSDYEVQLVKSSGTTPSGPSLSTYHTISTTRQWTLTSVSGSKSFSGTMYIREIANTSNVVSASVNINVLAF